MTDNGRALGVAFPPMEARRGVLVRTTIRAEELGYDGFFVAEAWGLEPSPCSPTLPPGRSGS
jgi:alkanesulfonate monooxygenase SsuD/methylene tetrahydromethanopterin reductase-like flavin-dependent oxidoreductase (luciferase family)